MGAVDRMRTRGERPDSVSSAALFVGCYVGEVLGRNLGLAWVMPHGSASSRFAVVQRADGVAIDPIGSVRDRLTSPHARSLAQLFEATSSMRFTLAPDLLQCRLVDDGARTHSR